MDIRELLIRYTKWYVTTMQSSVQIDETNLLQTIDYYLQTEDKELYDTPVMRSAYEVILRLKEVEKELDYNQNWYKKASDSYFKDKRIFGQADDGEMMIASEAVSECKREVAVLKWVLGHSFDERKN
jgi:hypothetical protein